AGRLTWVRDCPSWTLGAEPVAVRHQVSPIHLPGLGAGAAGRAAAAVKEALEKGEALGPPSLAMLAGAAAALRRRRRGVGKGGVGKGVLKAATQEDGVQEVRRGRGRPLVQPDLHQTAHPFLGQALRQAGVALENTVEPPPQRTMRVLQRRHYPLRKILGQYLG